MQFESSLTLLNTNTPVLLEKRIKLLQAIAEVGSISKAAKLVPMSYKTAWEAIDSINNLSTQLVVKKETGGKGGGGAKITSYGQNLLNTYLILQVEHTKFLKALTKITDFQSGNLKQLQRFNMQISARNQISAKIEEIKADNVNASVTLKIKSGQTMLSNISKTSIENLSLKQNDEVIAIFKSNSVMIATNELLGFSARNKIKGTISDINYSEVNAQITVLINETDSITALITKEGSKELNLQINQEVYAIIKSSDIMIGN